MSVKKQSSDLVPLMVYFSAQDKRRMRKKAKELGLNNMSAYVRSLVRRDLREIPERRRTT
jgi:hypothetical protein